MHPFFKGNSTPISRHSTLFTLTQFLIVVLYVVLAGCSSTTGTPTASALLSDELFETAIAQTVEAGQVLNEDVPLWPRSRTTTVALTPTRTPRASSTPLPTSTPTTTPTPTITPTSTVTPTPTATPVPLIPLSEIEINSPGPWSKVTSPFSLRALLVPGDGGKVTIELLGEDGRLLFRKISFLLEDLGRKAGMVEEIEFDIAAVAETARLQILVDDAFGRPRAISSVDLILLSEGVAEINVPGDLLAPVVVTDPLPDALIQGGTLILTGLARPIQDQFLVVELVSEQGKVVGNRVIEVPNVVNNEHSIFVVEIPYNVDDPTRVRLTIRERGDRIAGAIHLLSMEVLLSP
jgi:hypothetical protein